MFLVRKSYLDETNTTEYEICHWYVFELMVHPTKIESPELVLNEYNREDDGQLVKHYHRNAPVSLNNITLDEIRKSPPFTRAWCYALEETRESIFGSLAG